jgi:hypothetical protein
MHPEFHMLMSGIHLTLILLITASYLAAIHIGPGRPPEKWVCGCGANVGAISWEPKGEASCLHQIHSVAPPPACRNKTTVHTLISEV